MKTNHFKLADNSFSLLLCVEQVSKIRRNLLIFFVFIKKSATKKYQFTSFCIPFCLQMQKKTMF